jgi:ribose/xylose/arabinose/galactoside ABC-type transport system permease subunit
VSDLVGESVGAPADAGSLRATWPKRAVRLLENYGIILVLIGLFAGISISEPSFATWGSISNMLQQYAPVGIMAMAGTFVIIAGGFDFSVGGVYAFAATLSAGIAQHDPLGVAYGATLAMGLGVGLANGIIVTSTRVNPFIATIGMGQIFRGVALIYSGGKPLIPTVAGFGLIGGGFIGSFPIAGIFLIGLYVIGAIVLHRTVYGRSLYAVGGNAEAARLSGLRVNTLLIATYGLSGLAAAMAGMLFASRLGLGQGDVGFGIEIDVIIAIVIGGTAIGGGSGAMWRTAVGLGIVAVMTNGFDALQISSNTQVVVKGAVLIAAVTLDEVIKRRRAAATVASRPPRTSMRSGGPAAQGAAGS